MLKSSGKNASQTKISQQLDESDREEPFPVSPSTSSNRIARTILLVQMAESQTDEQKPMSIVYVSQPVASISLFRGTYISILNNPKSLLFEFE